MNEKEPLKDQSISHSMCKECYEKIKEDTERFKDDAKKFNEKEDRDDL
ncbi:MAG TPA: hypothetical protein VLB01_06915 [Thermodesulfobacteriota bacterium]|nr:hypothetical protein [Thermodesulfobacteriota bacterium]